MSNLPDWVWKQEQKLHRLVDEARMYEFAALPTGVRHALLQGGYYYRAQVERATDDELLACINLGKRSLAKIRAVMPYEPAN